jgi:hypothetical protein
VTPHQRAALAFRLAAVAAAATAGWMGFRHEWILTGFLAWGVFFLVFLGGRCQRVHLVDQARHQRARRAAHTHPAARGPLRTRRSAPERRGDHPMSSTFYTVCLSHDPALLAREHRSAEEAEAAVREGASGHEDCDQLIIRSSGAPVEVGCPGHGTGDNSRLWKNQSCRLGHRDTEWVDVGWLHVLAHARLAGALPENVARHHDLSCWTEQRLRRLREELGLELPHRVDEPGEDQPEVVHPDAPVQASAPPAVDESGAGLAAEVARLRAHASSSTTVGGSTRPRL